MSDITQNNSQATQFDELPDAPPKRKIKLSWAGKTGVVVLIFWAIIVVIGPMISPYHEGDILDEALFMVPGGDEYPDTDFQPPSKIVYLGTDYLGRDTLSRILYGARTTIGISFIATLWAYAIGVTLGIAAAVGSKLLDMTLSRLNDAVLAIPSLMLALVMIAALGSTIPLLILLTGIIYAASVFRIARSLGQEVMVSDFVEAARVRGEGLWWIITREILPNIMMPLATDFGLRFVWVILFVSALSFLGLGIQPPTADWGSMVRDNATLINYDDITPLLPAAAIAILTVAVNFVVDWLLHKSSGLRSD